MLLRLNPQNRNSKYKEIRKVSSFNVFSLQNYTEGYLLQEVNTHSEKKKKKKPNDILICDFKVLVLTTKQDLCH